MRSKIRIGLTYKTMEIKDSTKIIPDLHGNREQRRAARKLNLKHSQNCDQCDKEN